MATRASGTTAEGMGNEDQTQNPGEGNLNEEDRRQDAGGAADDPGEEQTTGEQNRQVGDDDDADFYIEDDDEPPARGANQRQPDRARRRIAALEDEIRELRTRPAPAPTQPVQQEETQEQFEGRIQMLPPDERMEARLQRSDRMNNQRLQIMQIQMADQTDRAAYEAKATHDKRFAKYSQEVEQRLADLRRQGQNVSREALLKFIIGEKVLGNPTDKRVRQAAQRRVENQRVRPANTRGDQGGDTQRRQGGDGEREARRKRLENATF
jgi:hypothetical protein